MTYLQAINAVLRRLREPEVTAYDQNNYSKLIGDFVNETKREVEDAWDWLQLRTTIQVTTVADTFKYTLTGAGNRYHILQVINDTEDTLMRPASYKWMNYQFTVSDTESSDPYYYDINGSSSGDPNVDLFPIPDGVYTINFNLVVPQDDLSANADTITVPEWPVVLGAYAKAISERGDDGGANYTEIDHKYMSALSDAIAKDAEHATTETTWVVV